MRVEAIKTGDVSDRSGEGYWSNHLVIEGWIDEFDRDEMADTSGAVFSDENDVRYMLSIVPTKNEDYPKWVYFWREDNKPFMTISVGDTTKDVYVLDCALEHGEILNGYRYVFSDNLFRYFVEIDSFEHDSPVRMYMVGLDSIIDPTIYPKGQNLEKVFSHGEH